MMYRSVKNISALAAVILLWAGCALSSCNAQKRNTALSRQYTAFITRYNIFYNGETHFDETLNNMEKSYEDNFTDILLMHPIEAKNDNNLPQPTGNFNRSIEKAQKAIQVRSIKKKPAKKSGRASDPEYKAWMQRDEYNPFIHNAWMLMGKSQYYNGDFLGAASTFFYVSKHFTWLPKTVTEAKIWQALSYVSLDWPYEAELILNRIKPEDLATRQLTDFYNYTYADLLLHNRNYEGALPYLERAVDGASGVQKLRLRYLLGQVYQRLGMNEQAYQAFKKVSGSNSATYRTKFNARISQSEVFTGENIAPEVRSLRNMTRYDRNKDYLDQIYYAIGNLYLSRGDTLQAMENYQLAVDKSTRSGIEKAVAEITLGTLYFDRGNYEKAQPCYAEAVPLLPETYPDYQLLKRRSDVLDELAVYSQNVNLQDSLLHLASLPEDQLNAVIAKIIDDLNKREREEAEQTRREEYLAQQNAQGNSLQDNNSREYNINADNSWYFYNAATKNAGKTEFQRRWGARRLEDDWRRRNKSTFNTADFDAPDDEEDGEQPDSEQADRDKEAHSSDVNPANDPHYPEYYLQQIPRTPEEVQNANEIIQEGLYNMGVILKDKLEDFPAAQAEFDRLLTDYPDNIYRLDVYFNLYLMYMRMGREDQAEHYRQLILQDFPDSNYGLALRDPDYIQHLREMDQVQETLYEQAYTDYLDNNNQAVHQAYETMMDQYPMSRIMPKFMFLHALAYVTDNEPEEFNAVLREMLERYPDTDLTPYASAWLRGMAQGRNLQTGLESGNMRGMLWDIHLTNDSTFTANDSIAGFVLDDEAPQLLVMVFATDEVPANNLLYEVARHNFNSFVVKDFDLEMMNFGRLGMLVVKGFDNMRELNHYRNVMERSTTFTLPPEVRPVPISVDNFDRMLQQGRSFDEYFRFLEEQTYLDAQEGIVPPDEVETLEEREETETPEPAETPETTTE